MLNLRERIEEIIRKTCHEYHQIQDKSLSDILSEATDQILQAVEEVLPIQRKGEWQGNDYDAAYLTGFNSCLAQIRERIGEG